MTDETKEKLEFYLAKAEPLFAGLEAQEPKDADWGRLRKEFLEMTLGYYRDALHFKKKGEFLRALMALEYAEGWLDAGKRIGLFK
jgi:hypothetical protein